MTSVPTYSSGCLDLCEEVFVIFVEEEKNKRLKERHLQFLVSLREARLQHTVSERWLPLKLTAAVFVQVEELESFQVLHHLWK